MVLQTYIQIEFDGCFDHPWHLASRPDQEVDTGCLRRETVWRIISTLRVVLFNACDLLDRILGTIPDSPIVSILIISEYRVDSGS